MQAAGLRAVAITDHDTLAAFVELRARGAGRADAPPGSGPRLLAGVEINVHAEPDGPRELHLLGLGIDPAEPSLAAALERQRTLRRARALETVERLRSLGLPIDDELRATLGPGVDAVGRPHLARALIAAGRATSIEDAFARLLGRGGPAYVPRESLSAREAIEAIRAARGVAVLAHTVDAPDHVALLDRLQDWGLGGLEVFYGGMGRPFTPVQVARLERFATERGLLATGGTDYHGDAMTYREALSQTWIPARAGDALLAAVER